MSLLHDISDVYEITLPRHGESVGNIEERFQGQSDDPLTDAGRAQARTLAERWLEDGTRFDLVLTSPLVQARETAEITASILNVPLESDPVLMERNTGKISGLTRQEAIASHPQPEFVTPYDSCGESSEEDWALYLRAGKAVHGLTQRAAGRYLAVTHGGLLNKMMCAILGIPVQANFNGPSFRFGSTGFAVFHYVPSRHQWRMMRLKSPVSE